MLHIIDRNKDAVVVPGLGVNAETQAGQQAGKHLDHKGQAIALMPLVGAHRQNGPAGEIVVGVGSRIAVLIHNPAQRHRLAAAALQVDFAHRHRAGRHIQQHRPLQVAGDADADGIGAEPPRPAAKGGGVLGAGPGIRRYQANHPLLQGHRGIVAHPPHMALMMDGQGGDAVVLGLVNRHPHRLFGLDKAETPVAVDDGGIGRFPLHHKRRAGDDMAAVNAAAILGQLDDAMGIVADQVGFDLMGGDNFRLGRRRPLGDIDVISDPVQVIVGKDRHKETSKRGGSWGIV